MKDRTERQDVRTPLLEHSTERARSLPYSTLINGAFRLFAFLGSIIKSVNVDKPASIFRCVL